MALPSPPLRLPPRAPQAHKGDFGRVLMIGGSRGMAGSISLASIAALRVGSGLVSAAVPDRCVETVAAFHPCLMTVPLPDDGEGRFAPEAVDSLAKRWGAEVAVGCGPGMTTASGSIRIVEHLMARHDLPRVLDADALNALAEIGWPGPSESESPRRASVDAVDEGFKTLRLVLTPHPGELARLVGVKPSDRAGQIGAAQELARRTGAVIVVKGGPTVVVAADQRWTNTTGNPGMASGGTGDVLTGMITSLLGQGFSAWDAARLGVWMHGRAGDVAAERIGQASMLATDLLDQIAVATSEATPSPN